jgi:cell division protein FtsL
MKINFKERTPQLIAIIVVLVVIVVIAIVFSISKTQQISNMEQQYAIEKQQLEDEYEAISLQYEGFKFSVKNDSLLAKLESEQANHNSIRTQNFCPCSQ